MKVNGYPALAEKLGTPAYCFDEAALVRRMAYARQQLGEGVRLCYSIKANPFILPVMARIADHIEVCSPGELTVCEGCGLDMGQVVFSGVNKTRADVDRAMADGVGIFTAESPLHLEHINAAALAAGKRAPVLLRLSSGNQFGMDEATLTELVRRRGEYPGVELRGLHYFSGTQKQKPEIIGQELARLEALAAELAALGCPVQQLEYGPGLGVQLFAGEGGEEAELALLEAVAPALRDIAGRYALTVEMGRWFTARCGVYLTRVADVKHSDGVSYAILDGGIHHLNYYGQTMAMKLPPLTHYGAAVPGGEPAQLLKGKGAPPDAEALSGWCLCGSLCTVADVLVRQVGFAHPLQPGDLLAFAGCGAYSVTEAPVLFLTREMPAVALRCADGALQLLRPRRTTAFLNSGADMPE